MEREADEIRAEREDSARLENHILRRLLANKGVAVMSYLKGGILAVLLACPTFAQSFAIDPLPPPPAWADEPIGTKLYYRTNGIGSYQPLITARPSRQTLRIDLSARLQGGFTYQVYAVTIGKTWKLESPFWLTDPLTVFIPTRVIDPSRMP